MTQPDFVSWLQRKPSQKKPRKPMRRVAKKRAKQLREYSKRAEAFLADRPICEAWLQANGVERVSADDYTINTAKRNPVFHVTLAYLVMHCQAPYSTEVHHKEGRIGAKLLDESTWLAVCRDWHLWIHAHPSEAREKGWLV